MDSATTRAWILLSVPDTPSLLPEIIGMADGLNKAIPTHAELVDSLGWLGAADLVHCDGDKYRRTPAGISLLERCGKGCSGAFELWDNVTSDLRERAIADFVPADLSEDQVQAAYKSYSQDFWEKYKALDAKDN